MECISGDSFPYRVCEDQVPLSNWVIDLEKETFSQRSSVRVGVGGSEGLGAQKRELPLCGLLGEALKMSSGRGTRQPA